MRMIIAFRENPLQAIFSAIGVFLLVPVIQLLITPLAFEIWYKTLLARTLNSVLYIIFSGMFGILVSLYTYSKNKCIDCKKGGVSAGLGGATLGFVLGICPACFSIIGVLIPLGTSIFLTTYSPAFTSFAIGTIVFSIYRLGGFKKR